MTYEKIDLDKWDRGGLFHFYIRRMRIVMSLTAEVDVSPLLAFTRNHGLKFYPAMIWVVAAVGNSRDEFKYGWDGEGNLIRWDGVSPSYADFHKDDQRFTKLTTPFSDDLFRFHARFLEDREAYRDTRGFAGNPPPNFFDVSCLPWTRYRHIDLHVFDEGTFLAPVVTWGKYEAEGDALVMPLTMAIHHAVADGFHLSRFFQDVQQLLYSFRP